MGVLTDLTTWLAQPERWSGSSSIPVRLLEHLQYSVLALLIAAAVALPVALWVGHLGRGEALLVNLVNVGRAVPTFGLILLAVTIFGIGLTPALIALVALAVPPIVANAAVGIRQVDPDVRESAQGMGMTGWQVLRRVELPVALPLIMAGLRTSAVQVVATATLAAYPGLGGLGRFIIDGFAQGVLRNANARSQTIVGALLVALLAVLTELAFSRLERIVVPRGLQQRDRPSARTPSVQTSALQQA